MPVDIFKFWSKIGRSDKIHPADRAVFKRVGEQGHGMNLKCLPAAFAGKLRDAPVVLLFLSPGLSRSDLRQARTRKGHLDYVQMRSGIQPLGRDWNGRKWLQSRIKPFGLDYDDIREKIAVLNIGAYHSRSFTDYPLLAAVPSSRLTLDWAQGVLFPQALKGERVVICLRAAHFWGLEVGRCHGGKLFAPFVTRGGHIMKSTKAQQKLRKEIICAVSHAVLS